MKIDLDELERKARAASTQDEWQWRPGDLGVLEGKHDGQIVIYVHRSKDADLDGALVASNRDRWHIAANSPPVTLALVARIRELELGRAQAFVAGYDAGWESTGEGKNAEHTSKRYTQGRYEAERAEALAAFEKGVSP